MFDFSKLMALSEATTGFEGGTLVDEMPSYTLAECMDTLPMVIMESQLEQYDIVEKQNEIMVESVIDSINTGISTDYDTLVEAGISSLKEHFMNFLMKIKRFIDSIIVKIKALFMRRKNDAGKLISRYEKTIKMEKLKDMTFKGYGFDKDVLKTSIPGGITEVVGKIAPALSGGLTDVKANAEQIKGMMDEDHATRAMKVANEVTGMSLSNKETWPNDLTKELMGITDDKNPKIEMKYGEHCFTVAKVKAMLTNHAALQDLLKTYGVMQKDIQKNMNDCKKLQKSTEDTDANKGKLEYYNAYIQVYQDCANAMNKVNASVKRFVDTQWVQASQMWVAMAQRSSDKSVKAEESKTEDKPTVKSSENKSSASKKEENKSASKDHGKYTTNIDYSGKAANQPTRDADIDYIPENSDSDFDLF